MKTSQLERTGLDAVFATLWRALDTEGAPHHDLHWLLLRCIDVRCASRYMLEAQRADFARSLEQHNSEFTEWPVPAENLPLRPETRLDRIAAAIWSRAGLPTETDVQSLELLMNCANAQLLRGAPRERNVEEIEAELVSRGLQI